MGSFRLRLYVATVSNQLVVVLARRTIDFISCSILPLFHLEQRRFCDVSLFTRFCFQ